MEAFRRIWCAERNFSRGLSLGCGDGALERDVRRKGICESVVGIDISDDALRLAREHAAAEGLDAISYRRGDLNHITLPHANFDIVFFHQSLHHVVALEHCLEQVAAALRPGGVLYVDEYVGPTRTDWNEAMLAHANRIYRSLPGELRNVASVMFPIEEDDPSEAVRSSEIVPQLQARFDFEARRDYGGNLLALLHPLIDWGRLDSAGKAALLERLIDDEDRLLAGGEPSFYTVIVAIPR
jgi:SAM-dependent methyltransferase